MFFLVPFVGCSWLKAGARSWPLLMFQISLSTYQSQNVNFSDAWNCRLLSTDLEILLRSFVPFSKHVFIFPTQVHTHIWFISWFLLRNLIRLFSKLRFSTIWSSLKITRFDQVSSRCHKIAQIVHFFKRKTIYFYSVSISKFSDFGNLIKISRFPNGIFHVSQIFSKLPSWSSWT